MVFGNLLKGRLPGNPTIYGYSIYLCCGILLWNFFGELLQRSQGLYLENANLLKKAAFPRSALSVINFFASSINFALAMALLFVFLVATGAFPGLGILWLVPVWLTMSLLALGLGLCIAVLQVFFRDFGALTAIGLQALFWATPIVYPADILPAWLTPWLWLNPLWAPVSTAQAVLLGNPLPAAGGWLSTAVVGVIDLQQTAEHLEEREGHARPARRPPRRGRPLRGQFRRSPQPDGTQGLRRCGPVLRERSPCAPRCTGSLVRARSGTLRHAQPARLLRRTAEGHPIRIQQSRRR